MPGLPPQIAAGIKRAFASGNPQAMQIAQTLLQRYVAPTYDFKVLPDGTVLRTSPTGTVEAAYQGGKPDIKQTGEDMYGGKTFSQVYPDGRVVTLGADGQPIAAGTGANSSGALKGVNSNLFGDDYLKQFPPEVQAAVKDYVDGKSMPTGNPRKGFTQAVKMVAQKYAQDIGTSADDSTFAGRRKMRTELNSASPGSLGGQLNIGNTAIGHLADLSDRAAALDNKDILGIPSLSHVVNSARGEISTDQAAKMRALQDAAQHYGQEITKFYAGSPGGEAERNRFIAATNAALTPKELSAVIASEAELMHSRLKGLESQITGTLGPAAKQYPVIRPESEKAFARIQQNVRRLSGEPAAAPGAARAAAQASPVHVATPEEARRLPSGTSIILPDGSQGRVP
jgi:hypothetical protein